MVLQRDLSHPTHSRAGLVSIPPDRRARPDYRLELRYARIAIVAKKAMSASDHASVKSTYRP